MKKIILFFSMVVMTSFFVVQAQGYKVTSKVNNTAYGTISPAENEKNYNAGENIVFTLTPAANHELLKLSVNGVDKTAEVADGKFTVTNLSEDLVIIASFRPTGQNYYLTMSAVGGYPDNPPSASNLPITRVLFNPETKSCNYSITPDDHRKYVAVRVANNAGTNGTQPTEVATTKWYVVGMNFCMERTNVTKPGVYSFTYSWDDAANQYLITETFKSLLPFTIGVDVSAVGWTNDIYVHVKGTPERSFKMEAKQGGWYSYTFAGEAEPVDMYFTNGPEGTGDNKSGELANVSTSANYAVNADRTVTETVYAVKIGTAADLVNALTANTDPNTIFHLTADIDMGAWITANVTADIRVNGWRGLGTSAAPITGIIDGQGYFLYNIWSNRPGADYVGGFIAYANNLTMKNLGIKTQEGKALIGRNFHGGFISTFTNNVRIERCCFVGTLRGEKQIGCFLGQNQDGAATSATIKQSYAFGAIYPIIGRITDNVGGLWGKASKQCTSLIDECYAAVTINGQGGQGTAGGILGSGDLGADSNENNILYTIKNTFAFNDTISGVYAAARMVGFSRNNPSNGVSRNVAVINSVQLDDAATVMQGNQTGAPCINATYTRSKQQVFEVDTVFTNRAWDFNAVWQFKNANYPAPVLKNLNMEFQPTGVPKHLTGIFADFVAISVTGGFGTITPSKPFSVPGGTNVEFTITPAENYKINKLLVNGDDKTSNIQAGKYTVANASKITYTIAVSFESLNNIETLEPDAMPVYPNPTDGKLFIKTDVPATVSVYDHAGRLLQTSIVDSVLDLSGYPSGFYLVKVKGQYVKVIKK